MRTISLTEAPQGIDPQLWRIDDAPAPVAGDLWLLSWDGTGLALGMVSSVHDGFVLVWPVSLPGDPVSRPAVTVTDTPLGVDLHVWPSRETGVGIELLHRRLGSMLDQQTIAATADAFDDGEPPPLPFADEPTDEQVARDYSLDMIEAWESICLRQWPQAGRTIVLDPDLLRRAELTPSRVAKTLGLESADAIHAFRGESSLSTSQAEQLASSAGVDLEDLAAAASTGLVARLLVQPARKASTLAVASALGVGESQARDRIAAEYALAARSSGDASQRLDAVFDRMLRE